MDTDSSPYSRICKFCIDATPKTTSGLLKVTIPFNLSIDFIFINLPLFGKVRLKSTLKPAIIIEIIITTGSPCAHLKV